MILERALDEVEVAASLPVSIPVQYCGYLDDGILRRAWNYVCANNPVLMAQVRDEKDRRVLFVPSDAKVDIVVYDGDEALLRTEATRPRSVSDGVARLMLVRGRGGGFLCLMADHAVVDGAAVLAIMGEVWAAYTDLLAGREVSNRVRPSLPRPPTELFVERWGEYEFRQLNAETRNGGMGEMSSVDLRRIVLDKRHTSGLRNVARRVGVSVHGLLCGSILVALRRGGSGTDRALMVCDSNVDLRDRVSPAVGATETTNFFTQHKAKVPVRPDDDPVQIGRNIKAQLDSAIAQRALPLYQGPGDRYVSVETTLPSHLAFCHISNRGSLDEFRSPPGVEVVDLVLLLPEESPLSYSGYACWTLGGRLTVYCAYPSRLFVKQSVDSIVCAIKSQLTSMSGS